ncbi:MAG TPA: hypothetical protein VHN98_10230 [Acidimicrobiales bacterium]|nr:hypothetical protein [Acidimicrobiales bacterium]
MILVEIRPAKGKAKPIAVHPRVTVIDPHGRKSSDVTASIAKALRGEGGDLDVTAEVDGRRQRVTRDVAACGPRPVVIVAGDVPVPRPAATTAPPDATAEAEAAVALAESAVHDSRASLRAAEAAWTDAESTLMQAHRDADAIDVAAARAALEAAEARLEVASAGAAAARRALVEARETADRDAEERRAADARRRDRIDALDTERSELAARRDDLTKSLAAIGDAEPQAIEDALSALRRLREVKPKPSSRALALADRWVAVQATLASMPAPPSPPEWLATPALVALQDARRALQEAERGGAAGGYDRAQVAEVEKAHAELLDAEQRAVRKGSRINRRRLEQAEEAERAALHALGVSSYGDFLQDVVPVLEGGQVDDRRVSEARAALANAEAVWGQLHGGSVDPAWTAAREEVVAVRAEAADLLGADCADDEIEARLRGHVESVVDTGWAEEDLADALRRSGAMVGDDVEVSAEEWLREAPALRERQGEMQSELGTVESRLAEVDEQLERLRALTHFGLDDEESVEGRAAEEQRGGISPNDPFAVLAAALEESEAAEKEAQAAMTEATAQLDREAAERTRIAGLEAGLDERQATVDDARRRVAEAEAALAAAREAGAAAARSAEAAREAHAEGEQRRAATRPLVVTEAVLLARLATAAADGAAVVIDGRVITEHPASARRRLLALLDRAGDRVQVVVVGGGDLMAWGRGLGGRAAARTF